MKYLPTKKAHQLPAGVSGPHLTVQRMLVTLKGIAKIIILIIILSSCGSMKINGIELKGRHRKAVSDKDVRWFAFTSAVGIALGIHFKEDLKKIGQ